MRILVIPYDQLDHPKADVRLTPIIKNLPDEYEILGIERIPCFNTSSEILRYVRFFSYSLKIVYFCIKNNKNIDLIFAVHPWHGLIGSILSFLIKKPLAYDNHDGNQLLYSQFLQTSLLYKKLNLILERFLGYLSKVMVVPSNLDKKLYIDQNFRYKDKIIVIPSGIDFSSINKINKNKFLLRSRLGINLSKKVLIFGGNRDYQPNKEAVLWINEELAPILENNFNEIMIIITGSGDIPPNIHPIIKFTGYIQDYFEHIIASDIGIVPYHMNTGISTKTIDYLASGLPTIITPEVASLFPQLIDGENIIIARDRQEFINKIIYVLNHSEEGAKIGARGKEVIEKYYDMEVVGRAWRELFKSCLRDNLQIRV